MFELPVAEQLKKMFFPYAFVLKEGTKIKNRSDLLGYSLELLQTVSVEKISSPLKGLPEKKLPPSPPPSLAERTRDR